MKTQRNPVHQSGVRNAFCPHYKECLDSAIQKGWEDWDCSSCHYKTNQDDKPEMRLTVNETIAYYEMAYDA
jgi:tRNA(Ile2) C34 agmatinyltransferase TiaS